MVLLFIFLASTMLPSISIVRAQEDTWTNLDPMPTARMGLGTAVVNGKIYAIGGLNSNLDTLNVNEEYDPTTKTWTTKTPMPTPRNRFGITVFENKIYVIGGNTGDYTYTRVTEVYDPTNDSWETKTSMPTPREAMDANLVDGKIYVIGGKQRFPNVDFDINQVYDPVNDSWSSKTSMPIGIDYYASAVINNKIYLIGGGDNNNLNQIYDPQTDTWSNGTSLPVGVDSAAAGSTIGVMASKRIYVIGGKQNLEGKNFNQIYDPETNTWIAGISMPTPRHSHGVVVVDDVLYVLGGSIGWFGDPIVAVNEQYMPAGFEIPSPSVTPTPLPEPESLTTLVLASVAIVVIVGFGIFAYFKKNRRKKTE